MIIRPFKMRVTSEQSKRVQLVIFANNYDWHFSPEEKRIRFTEMPFLHFWTPLPTYLPELFYISKDKEDYFNFCKEEEITFEEFIEQYANEDLFQE